MPPNKTPNKIKKEDPPTVTFFLRSEDKWHFANSPYYRASTIFRSFLLQKAPQSSLSLLVGVVKGCNPLHLIVYCMSMRCFPVMKYRTMKSKYAILLLLACYQEYLLVVNMIWKLDVLCFVTYYDDCCSYE
jgi:hypothetical protein